MGWSWTNNYWNDTNKGEMMDIKRIEEIEEYKERCLNRGDLTPKAAVDWDFLIKYAKEMEKEKEIYAESVCDMETEIEFQTSDNDKLRKVLKDATEYYDTTNFCELNCDPSVGHHEPECCIIKSFKRALE